MEEIGYEEVFNETEVQDINSLFDKTTNAINENQQMMEQISKIVEDTNQEIMEEDEKDTDY